MNECGEQLQIQIQILQQKVIDLKREKYNLVTRLERLSRHTNTLQDSIEILQQLSPGQRRRASIPDIPSDLL